MTLKRKQPSVLPRPSQQPRPGEMISAKLGNVSKGAEGFRQSGRRLFHRQHGECNSPVCQQRALQNAAGVLG